MHFASIISENLPRESHQNVMNDGSVPFYVRLFFKSFNSRRMLKQFVKFNDILHFYYSSCGFLHG